MRFSLSILTLAALAGPLCAEVKPNSLFSNGAVLQRGQKIPVWGSARDGEKVTVEFQGQKVSTTAANGKWRVNLEPLTAGGPFPMTLRGDNTVTIEDLLVGEVWLCSGQSNMNLRLQQLPNVAEEAAKANAPQIRTFEVPVTVTLKPLDQAQGTWVACTPETVKKFSAVGYYFAREIQQQLGVPVGLIHSALGATPAQSWTSIDALKTDPALQEYVEKVQRKQATYEADLAAYPALRAAYKTKLAEWMAATGKQHEANMKAWEEAVAKAKQSGEKPPRQPRPATPRPKEPVAPDGVSTDPTVLFNGMIAPIVPYGIKGVLWYQGESNRDQATQYRTLFPAMIHDWRARWQQGDFPFLYVQIAPWGGMTPEIREAQLLSLAKVKNAAMTVTTDVGDAEDIHPRKKQPVGQRLALAARALAYGESIEFSGPLYQSMKIENGKVILHFTHTGKGLVAKDGPLKGFTIAGKDKTFVPATAEIQGNTVVVSAPTIAEPVAVRYGWANVPDVNFYNQEGLPASPFRTDVE